jgi:hypothetical protein
MKRTTWALMATGIAVAMAVAGVNGQGHGRKDDRAPRHFSGLINDYTASSALIAGGPYEMRGSWTLSLDEHKGTADFSAVMNMETSDFGITQGSVNKDDPSTRSAHTHHISLTDGVVSIDWATNCPAFAPPVTGGFAVTGTAFITGNGSPAPFGNPNPLTICVLGGSTVEFSNLTLTFGMPAAKHFGTKAVHGVVAKCTGPGHSRSDCKIDQ